ncbi:MAG TPA: hypothetical protein PKD45_14150 [Flavobacteriales bacterium]|nr:hypothetical protein [Flavobacteriales bacterium]
MKAPPCTLLALNLLVVGALGLAKPYEAAAVFFPLGYLFLLADVRHVYNGLQFGVAFVSALLLGVSLDLAGGIFPWLSSAMMLLLCAMWLRRIAFRHFGRTRSLWLEPLLLASSAALVAAALVQGHLAFWKLVLLAPLFGVALYVAGNRLRRGWRMRGMERGQDLGVARREGSLDLPR